MNKNVQNWGVIFSLFSNFIDPVITIGLSVELEDE